ncbi:hypothetical protein AXF42_Ash003982 [Apostasia shenzhenica]|uniref:R3H-associated N-terminal domain-containing protein n=1 Tax=Apostasia shenzhenica TaxID=1088818 RepID=A0A2I0AIF9_9ASPA|nr:hypothetical protein AXF42_Ash003982 [Apostasia shenzhenica]
MANAEILKQEGDLLSFSIFDFPRGVDSKLRGQLIERKIEVLEGLACKVSNRRSRRWINDRLLIELVPRLHVDEIRGLFAPPPWGESTPLSVFCTTNVEEWDPFRSIDMDKEARLIKSLEKAPLRRKERMDNDKLVALNAWHRVDSRTRVAFRRNFLPDLVQHFESYDLQEQVLAFLKNNGDDVLVLHVPDPFHRLLLHGICEVKVLSASGRAALLDFSDNSSIRLLSSASTGMH